MAEVSLVKLLSDERHRTLLMKSQHWFRQWLGAIRHQAITWASVDPDLYPHMASQGHSELILLCLMMIHCYECLFRNDYTKQLPEPMKTYHQWSLLAFNWWQFHKLFWVSLATKCMNLTYSKILLYLPRGQWVKANKRPCTCIRPIYIKSDQFDPWIWDQLGKAQLSTILPLKFRGPSQYKDAILPVLEFLLYR